MPETSFLEQKFLLEDNIFEMHTVHVECVVFWLEKEIARRPERDCCNTRHDLIAWSVSSWIWLTKDLYGDGILLLFKNYFPIYSISIIHHKAILLSYQGLRQGTHWTA